MSNIIELTPKQRRMVETVLSFDDGSDITFLHSVMCQTSMPLVNQGDDTRVWESINGNVSLRVKAGEAMNVKQEWIKLGLPFGSKPRLILCYLNTKALIAKSPAIEVE